MARKSKGPRCGAKTKKGGTCQGVALENGRCRLHGGTASRRATVRRPAWSIARGLYTDGLHEEEMDIYGSVEIGTLELELKFLRVQLRRIVMAQKAYEEIHDRLAGEDWETMDIPPDLRRFFEYDGFERTEKKGQDASKHEFEEAVRKVMRRKRDYQKNLNQLLSLIAQLEVAHKELLKSGLFGSDALETMAADLRDFVANASATIPGKNEKSGS